MKKILIAALAVAALAACNKSEVVEAPKGAPIAFENAFVNNATKANDLNTSTLESFGVYGYVEANGTKGQIFNNQEVTGSKGSFTYTPPQYWIASAQYYFAAIAPKIDAHWTYTTSDAQNGTIKFDNAAAAANQDLLFAYNQPAVTHAAITEAPDPVAFDFYHILSRVKFTFLNGFESTSNMTFQVSDVHITNACPGGKIVVTNGTLAQAWDVTEYTGNQNIDFGDAEYTEDQNIDSGDAGTAVLASGKTAYTEHFYLIPTQREYNVTFVVNLYQAGVLVGKDLARSAKVTIDLQKGVSYNVKATLNKDNATENPLFPIVFDVNTIDEWDAFNEETATIQ